MDASPSDLLKRYRAKRDFRKTAEPAGEDKTSRRARDRALAFVIQKHAASHLHYDLRLELDGVMKSWAVPKGPSLNPAVKRLAMEVEDHPIEYNKFEGTIPKGQYGGGTVMLWDRGEYTADEQRPGESVQSAVRRGLAAGKLDFTFHGDRLHGSYALVRTRRGERSQWLLIKHHDEHALEEGRDITETVMTSVATGRTMEEIAASNGEVWQSNRLAPDLVGMLQAFQGENAIEPMRASASTTLPDGDEWAMEPRYEGTRVFAFAASGTGRLLVPGASEPIEGADAFDSVLAGVARHHPAPLVLDAIITEDEAGGSRGPLVLVDILVDGGDLLVDEPWIERRRRLDALVDLLPASITPGKLRASEWHMNGDIDDEDAHQLIAKRIDSVYQPGESDDWREIDR